MSNGPQRNFIATTETNLTENNYFQLLGLNEYAPDEVIKDSATPYARNFRIYDNSDTGTSRVAVSKRRGHAYYSTPVNETADANLATTTGASTQTITTSKWLAMKFTAGKTGNLTRIQLNLLNNNSGSAPAIVMIYTNNGSVPGALLATSSISNSSLTTSAQYLNARFIEAPAMLNGVTYWIVLSQQAEGLNDYKWTSTTASTLALTSSTSGNTWASTSFSLNFKTFISDTGAIKGAVRYYSTIASPVTIFAQGSNVYKIDDATGIVTSIYSLLSPAAVAYKWALVNNKLYFVNGIDTPKVYNGTTVVDVAGAPGVCMDITIHKNRLFLLQSSNRVIFSEPGDYENFLAVSFLYVPAPYTADQVVTMTPYLDYLHFFTKNTKWVLRGSDLSTFVLAESNAKKGAIGINAVTKDKSYVYFLSTDGIYRYNGGTDQKLSTLVENTISNIANPATASLVVHDNKLRIYYAGQGQAANNNCLIYDLNFNEWIRDENVYCGGAIELNSQSDNSVLLAYSSLVGAMYTVEVGTSDMGKPIEFDYWTKYFSFDHPSRKHRIKRLYTYFRPGSSFYAINVQIAVDPTTTPTDNYVNLGASGSVWGGGALWGGGATWGGNILAPTRLSIGGQARQHQIRFIQHGVDNPVQVLGFSTYTQLRRPI